jgi:hypothetical protein
MNTNINKEEENNVNTTNKFSTENNEVKNNADTTNRDTSDNLEEKNEISSYIEHIYRSSNIDTSSSQNNNEKQIIL